MNMKDNVKSSSPPSDKMAPPLRSTTVLRSPATNRTAAGGPNTAIDSIRLNTYHDSSDLKAALRNLEAAFAGPDNGAATSSPSSSPYTKFTLRNDRSNIRAAHPEQEKAASPSNQAKVTVVASTKAPAYSSSASPPCASRAKTRVPSYFLQLQPQLILHCFTFCDLKTLGVLCCVSIRVNVIVVQQGNALWAVAAQRRRIPITNAATPREDLRCALQQRAHARHAEEEYYESEIARMEERLRARSENVYAQNVDVDRTIATGGGSCNDHVKRVTDATCAAPPYWLRQQRMTEGGPKKSNGGATQGSLGADQTSTSTLLCAKLRTEIEALEKTKRLCECKLGLQEDSLRQQSVLLRQWQALLSPGSVSSAPDETATSPLITAVQLEQFERRIARLVLNGNIATTTTTTATVTGSGTNGVDESSAGIPFVFRRGVEDFATLALVLRAIGAHPYMESATPAAQGGLSTPSTAVRDAGKRWRAFQQVCPVNEEYSNVGFYLRSQMLRAAVPGTTESVLPNEDGAGRPSAKQTPALLRVSGFVRRVEAMTDSQVVQSWM